MNNHNPPQSSYVDCAGGTEMPQSHMYWQPLASVIQTLLGASVILESVPQQLCDESRKVAHMPWQAAKPIDGLDLVLPLKPLWTTVSFVVASVHNTHS